MTAPPRATAPAPRHAAERVPLASHDDHCDAERAVGFLSDQGFPMQQTAVIGRDVQLVEQIGRLFGLALHALQRGRRDFASVRAMTPTRYEVVADAGVAEEARAQPAKPRPVPGGA
ncbi:hypothetical protein VA596_37470 [Amycolatopsis sp., V23-08]|uniref:Uncharacterized protein n=1 Tax=Amycolatopsis heterodermiae TaxID=3110235 RepID=A0ABU5RI48_9PSEU|nr:hypothetical protein [Amycolatopsis sp., V23-08]MEA5365269.1 hypothetical protein [Amycolatopsis sp., V23-08]